MSKIQQAVICIPKKFFESDNSLGSCSNLKIENKKQYGDSYLGNQDITSYFNNVFYIRDWIETYHNIFERN